MSGRDTIESDSDGASFSTSVSLLERAKTNDPDAWRRLTTLYFPIVYRWCRRWGVRAEDTADIVQEVFQSVFNGISKFDRNRQGGTFRGWLYTIARNETVDHFHALRNRPQAAGGTDQQHQLMNLPAPGVVHEDSMSPDEPTRLLHAALDAIQGDFQEHTWQIFMRTAVECQSAVDVAQDFRMTPRAVRQAKHRVLKRLREIYGELLD